MQLADSNLDVFVSWLCEHEHVLVGRPGMTYHCPLAQSATPALSARGLTCASPNAEQPPACLQAGAVRKERVGTGRWLFQSAALRPSIKQVNGEVEPVWMAFETLL